MLAGRFARNVIPTRRSGVQIRARFIASWWKKVYRNKTRDAAPFTGGQNGRVEIRLFLPSLLPPRVKSLIRDESRKYRPRLRRISENLFLLSKLVQVGRELRTIVQAMKGILDSRVS